MRLSPVLSRGSSAAACRWALPAQSGGRYLAATAPSSTTVSAHKHQLQGPTSSSRKSFRSVPARCSGGSAVDAAGDSDGPGERGQPPPAPAKAANAVGGSSGAAKQPTDARPLNGIQQHQTQDVQTLPLREALVAPFFNEQVWWQWVKVWRPSRATRNSVRIIARPLTAKCKHWEDMHVYAVWNGRRALNHGTSLLMSILV